MPMKLLSRRPLPPPMAAPIAGSSAATPIRAPAAAPTAVPTAALATPLSLAACCGVPLPIRFEAYCWQVASSAWNSSKLLPSAGRAMTLGPDGGATAQALRASAAIKRGRDAVVWCMVFDRCRIDDAPSCAGLQDLTVGEAPVRRRSPSELVCSPPP